MFASKNVRAVVVDLVRSQVFSSPPKWGIHAHVGLPRHPWRCCKKTWLRTYVDPDCVRNTLASLCAQCVRASLLVLLMIGGLGGCSAVEPWIKPYERQNLADPIMSPARHGIANSYMHHVYQSREGARGAEGGSGGGCGCN